MSYTVCSNCGQKALTVATRCPRCGLAFEEQFFGRAVPTPRPRRTLVTLLIAGAVVTLFLANQLMHRFTVPAEEEALMPPPAPVVAHAPVTSPAVESTTSTPTAAIRQESTVTTPAPGPTQEVVHPPEPVRTPEPVHKTEPATVTTAPASTVAADIPEARRYASTWTNVRADRRNSASVLRVLRPGEAVQVDSLSQGWYRVTSHLQPAGYVDRRLLDTAPLPASP